MALNQCQKKDASQRKISNRITELKNKIRTIYKDKFPLLIRNPYKASALLFFGIYFCLSCFSWIRWHQYRSENLRLQQIEAKYEVDKAIMQELSPQLSITLYGYEKLTDQLGKEEIVEIFKDKIQELNSKKAP